MTAFALLSTSDTDVTVDTEKTKETLAEQLDSLSIVTAYSHALINTVINPISSPAEPWFGPLNDNLNVAKQHAQSWIKDIAPKVGSVIPQSIINYNNTFLAVSAEILRIIGGKTSLSADEKRDIIELIEATLEVLNEQQSAVDSVKRQIVTLSDQFVVDHDNLVSGQNSIAEAVKMANADRVRIETKIGQLQTDLDSARTKVTASGIGLGLSIFIAVAAFALAVATGGAGLIVAGAVGVIGVGVAATFTGIFNSEISSLLNEIHAEQVALESKKKQVVALTGLQGTVNSLRLHNESAKTALTQISTMWSTLSGKLDEVVRDLKGHKVDAAIAVQRMNINRATTSWKDTAAWAQKIQDLASGTKLQPVLQHDRLVRAFH